MSYCVNCGVELDSSAKKCALCGTPVNNPSEKVVQHTPAPFSSEIKLPQSINRKFAAYVVTMVLLIPNLVLLLVNIFFFRGAYWSVYIFATSLLIWTLFVFPFFTKKPKPYLMWAFDSLSVLAYFFVFFALGSETMWLFKCAAVIISLISVASLVLIIWLKAKKRHLTAIIIHLLSDAVVISAMSGYIVSVFSGKDAYFTVGIIITACCLALLGFFIYCNRSKHMRAWLRKAFYV